MDAYWWETCQIQRSQGGILKAVLKVAQAQTCFCCGSQLFIIGPIIKQIQFRDLKAVNTVSEVRPGSEIPYKVIIIGFFFLILSKKKGFFFLPFKKQHYMNRIFNWAVYNCRRMGHSTRWAIFMGILFPERTGQSTSLL